MNNFCKLCFFSILLPLLLTSCVSTQGSRSVDIDVNDPDRIRFSGKGSAAGIMLMGAMGPMGIAIGAAIDEGIGKEIDAAASRFGFDFDAIIQKTVSEESCVISSVTVNYYGFKMISGGDDLATPSLDIISSSEFVENVRLIYPDSENKVLLSAPLDELKKDGERVSDLLGQALKELLMQACVKNRE